MSSLKIAAVAAALSLGSTYAFAHATFEKSEATVGSGYKGVLRVPHGCGKEATHTVRVQLPPELVAVKPMPKAGWTLETKTGPYPVPYNNHGRELREGVREIIWSGGNLPDQHYDEFVFAGTVAPSATTDVLYVPVTQLCANGQQAWTEIPLSGQTSAKLQNPAPSIRLIKAQGHQEPAVFKAGAMTVTSAWTRATPKSAPVAGGFLSVTNTGKESDWLMGGSFANAGSVEVHEMSMDNGVMRMRALTQGLEIKPGQTIELKPGGYHLMFMQLKAPNVEGERIKGGLTFRNAGRVEIDFAVAPVGGPMPAASGGHQHHH